MRGLIRNNFYTIEGSLKVTILIGFLAMIVIAILGACFPNSSSTFLSACISAILGAFGALSSTAIQKDGVSKWNKFELTMPISRKDVITARYLSFLCYILIGILMAILSALLFYVVTGTIDLERMGFGFAFGTAFALSIPTLMIPLVLIFGADKSEALLMVSIVIGVGLFFLCSVIISPFLSDFSNANFVFRLGYLIFSILLCILSYLLSLCLYKKKEL